PERFLDQLRATVRGLGLSFATEKTYVHWAKSFIRFHGMRHPEELGPEDVDDYLNFLTLRQNCSVNTQRTALNALVFLYDKHLQKELGPLHFQYARKPRRMPAVFSHDEATAVIEKLDRLMSMMAGLMYGSGLRIQEVIRLRVKDLDFDQLQITVREGKGSNERMTLLPQSLCDGLTHQISLVEKLHAYDTACGHGEVYLPDALDRKHPGAARQTAWQYVFPATRLAVDPRCGITRRHHVHTSAVQKAVRNAIKRTLPKRRASSHTFRHSFATRLIESGYDIKLVQSLMGHRDIRTTEIYLHVVRNRAGAIKSPLDR
ncbi:MAG: integron integrase, partial [Pseudomonadota bacterium]